MGRTDSRGHLYVAAARPAIRVSLVIALFTIAYAVALLMMETIPLNMLLARFLAQSEMAAIWRNSIIQLGMRTGIAAVACWVALAISNRVRGRLTGPGMLALGATMSGALAGAVDAGLHHFWVRQMVMAAHSSRALGIVVSLGLTAAVAIMVTLLLITRSTQVFVAE